RLLSSSPLETHTFKTVGVAAFEALRGCCCRSAPRTQASPLLLRHRRSIGSPARLLSCVTSSYLSDVELGSRYWKPRAAVVVRLDRRLAHPLRGRSRYWKPRAAVVVARTYMSKARRALVSVLEAPSGC